MNKRTDGDVIDQEGREVLDPHKALSEQTLAVDLARAEIDQQIATAHKFPRSIDVVIKKISTMACYNEAAAENSIYSLPRGGKPILGASIGFANIVAQAWGNCRDGARIVYIDRREKMVVSEGAFLDLESNRQTIVPVNRRIVDSKGRLYNDDMIMVTGMAAASIARRNAILNAVPRAIWHPIYEDALQIVRGDVETFVERADKALKTFSQFGVKPEQVYMYLGVKGFADLTLEQIPLLRGMYAQLRDQVVTVEQMFDPRRMTGKGFETIADPLGADQGTAEEGDLHDAETGEVETAAEPAAQETARQAPAEAAEGRSTEGAATQPAKAKPAPAAQAGAAQGAMGPKEPKPLAGAAKAAAEKKAAAAAAGAEQQPAKAKPAPAAPKAEPKQAAPAAEPDKPAVPRTPEEYEAHAIATIDAATSLSALKNWWGSERLLRGECRVVDDFFTRIRARYDQKLAALQAEG